MSATQLHTEMFALSDLAASAQESSSMRLDFQGCLRAYSRALRFLESGERSAAAVALELARALVADFRTEHCRGDAK